MKKPLKIAAYVLGTPILIVLIFVIAVATRLTLSKDIPPPNDSDLRVTVAPISDDQNAYQDIVTIVKEYKEMEDKDDSLRESVRDAVDGFRSPPDVCLNLPQEHPVLYQAFLSASLKEAVVSPVLHVKPDLSNLVKKTPYRDFLGATKLINCHARALMEEHRESEAIGINEKIMRLGRLILNDGEAGTGFAIGKITLELGMETLRDFARTGRVSSAQLLEELHTLGQYGVSQESISNLISNEYNRSSVIISALAGASLFQPHRTQKMFANTMRKHLKELENPCQFSLTNKKTSKQAWGLFIKKISPFLAHIDPNGAGKMLIEILDGGPCYFSTYFCDYTVNLIGTRLVLALWAYHQDHGYFPNELTGLVPAYLPTLPQSPIDREQIMYNAVSGLITFGKFISPSDSYDFNQAPLVTPIEFPEKQSESPTKVATLPKDEAPKNLHDNEDLLKQKPDQIIKVTISQETLAKLHKDDSSLFTGIRAVPNFLGGQARGMKILSLKEESVFVQLGFKEKDIFLMIDKTPLDLKAGFSTFHLIGPKSKLLLQRDGKLVQINLVVR